MIEETFKKSDLIDEESPKRKVSVTATAEDNEQNQSDGSDDV